MRFMTFSKSILKKINTSDTKRPNSPQITIKNPLKIDTIVNGIELILSAEFSKKGELLILINDVPVFNENDSNQFVGYAKYPIPLGKMLKNSSDIKIFAWNGTDSNSLEMSMNLSISETPEVFNSQAVPLGKDVFNRVISESITIIPFTNYFNQTITSLLDMEGYRKLILMISAQNYTEPELELNEFVGYSAFIGDEVSARDGDFTTETDRGIIFDGPGSGDGATGEKIYSVDFGSNIARIPRTKGEIDVSAPSGGSATTAEVFFEVSEDNVIWTLIDTQTQTDTPGAPGTTPTPFDFTGSLQNFRYSRLRATADRGTFDISFGWGTASLNIEEIFDGNFLGGTAEVSFEVLDEGTSTWRELISAVSIGSVTQGTAKIITIGDVINDLVLNKFNFALPSTQTGLRVKLEVTGGGISTGVSIIKVD